MSNDAQQIEISIDEANGAVKLAKSLEKLFSNQDFEFVFEHTLFEKEAARLVAIYSDPAIAHDREEILKDIEMIGRIQNWMRNTLTMGRRMEQEIIASKKELELIDEEEQGE